MTTKYTQKNLELIRQSIEHWERDNVGNVGPEDVNVYTTDCPLCKEFLLQTDNCDGCPVDEKSCGHGCDNTPYGEVYGLYKQWKREGFKPPEFEKAVQEEINFLKSLKREYLLELNKQKGERK